MRKHDKMRRGGSPATTASVVKPVETPTPFRKPKSVVWARANPHRTFSKTRPQMSTKTIVRTNTPKSSALTIEKPSAPFLQGAPPKKPPNSVKIFTLECDEDTEGNIDFSKCHFNHQLDNVYIFDLAIRILNEIIKNPFKLPNLTEGLVSTIVSYVIDELAILLKRQEDKKFKTLLNVAITTQFKRSTDHTRMSTIIVRFTAKNVDEDIGLIRVEKLVKDAGKTMIQRIKCNVLHRLELRMLHA